VFRYTLVKRVPDYRGTWLIRNSASGDGGAGVPVHASEARGYRNVQRFLVFQAHRLLYQVMGVLVFRYTLVKRVPNAYRGTSLIRNSSTGVPRS